MLPSAVFSAANERVSSASILTALSWLGVKSTVGSFVALAFGAGFWVGGELLFAGWPDPVLKTRIAETTNTSATTAAIALPWSRIEFFDILITGGFPASKNNRPAAKDM